MCSSSGKLPEAALHVDAQAQKYSWVENWSEDHKRAFYYNQRTKESTWEKPADLAWKRIRTKPQPADDDRDEL
jgi:WW domain